MSVIGPRPALYNQYDLIEARDKVHANDIRPGLTGLAQVNGRDELPIDVKARYDGEYAAHLTFWMDLKIFFRSITYVSSTAVLSRAAQARLTRQKPENRQNDGRCTRCKPCGGYIFLLDLKNVQENIAIFVKICCKSQVNCVKYTL